jgi:hypothetical protein
MPAIQVSRTTVIHDGAGHPANHPANDVVSSVAMFDAEPTDG